ncbi:MAG: right-handed parallel beta-helix repeat-containing protein [Actinobacteria bacterium]|nr:right-handed parallel beta-helix repeat-containing protein [Actinomycetota bacterium]
MLSPGLLVACPSSGPPTATALHVSSAAGPDGDGTQSRPYASIDEALVRAQPGDQVLVASGEYPPFITVRPGTAEAPIRITGQDARIVGADGDRVINVTHSYVTLEGLDISGGDVLVRIAGAQGVRLLASFLHGADSECVRLRDGTSNVEVSGNRIERCGLTDFDLDADRKNGEGVYIGVAPEQLGDDPGASAVAEGNRVSDNDISVPGECVDVKEGAVGTQVDANRCTGSQDPDGAGFSSRGDETTFRDNVSTGHAGAGIRLGGDGPGQGVDNVVIGNRLTGNAGYGLKVERFPQGEICGNEITDNDDGVTNGEVDPRRPCPQGARGNRG